MSIIDNKITDEEIAQKIQLGQTDLFDVLIDRYEAKMLRYARKFLFNYEDAQDAIQNVFVKIFINIQSFDTAKRFSPWIYRIAHNEFINTIRKCKKEPVPIFNLDTLFPHFLSEEKADKKALEREAQEITDKYLTKLKPKYREVIILYYFEELSYKEIADVLRIPIATVGVRLKRAKELIKKKYDENTNNNK